MDIRAEVVAQITKLNKILALLDGDDSGSAGLMTGNGRRQGRRRRKMSAAARKRISDAQKKRWAAARSK